MYFTERHDKIISILKERNGVSVHYLAEKLHVSEPTIRRDLTFLEKQERIKVAQQISSNPNAIDELNNQPLNNSENPFSQFDMD